MGIDQGIRAEWIILADAASVVGGKLYLLGGGWDRVVVDQPFPYSHLFAVAVSFRVPWSETNARHQFTVEIQDEDGQVLLETGGHFEIGRPAGTPAGQPQRFQFTFTAQLEFKQEGAYAVLGRIEGEEVGRTTFSVAPGPTF